MLVRYGSYTSSDAENTISMAVDVSRDGDGNAMSNDYTWTIRGVAIAENAAALSAALTTLETAFNKDNQDAELLLNDGTPTIHKLTSAQTLNGVKSSRIRYPDGQGTEYVNRRTYEVVLTASYGTTDSASTADGGKLNYSETLTQTGNGGARYVIREPRNGPPIKQIVSQQTPIVLVQSGSATNRVAGLQVYPLPNPPLFPDLMRPAESSVTKTLNGASECVTSWTYIFDLTSSVAVDPIPRG
jgi:hypothetical protein